MDGGSSSWFSLSGMSSPVEIVDQVIGQAVRLGASDILFEPQEREVAVRLRVDGALQTFGVMPHGAYDQVLARLKVLGNMDVTENRKPQESKIRFDIEGHPYVLRAAIVSINYGQMVALRVLDAPKFTDLEQLGISEKLAEQIKRNIEGRYGLFLVCGPTGAGKTTTVQGCLKHLNNGEVNIMTLEDPIEYMMPGINQIEVSSDMGLDFAGGLRTILRLNPDVVFVGEIRDAETAKIAIQASLTGHLVISTVHSRNSVGALYRLMDLGVDKFMINYALRGVISQRLMRRLCDHCKMSYAPTEDEKSLYQKETGTQPLQLYSSQGCEMCNKTKYHGRVGIFELLEMNEDMRRMVLSGAGEGEFHQELIKTGFVDMNKEGIGLVNSGVTSMNEFVRTMYDAR